MAGWSGSWVQLKRMGGINPSTPLASQEGQIRYSRDGSVDGKLYVGRARSGGAYEWAEITGVVSSSGTPTVAALANAGSTATISVSGNDQSGTITLTPSGADIAVGSIIDLTFSVARSNTTYKVLISPGTTAARTLGGVVGRSARTTTKVTLSTATALTSGDQYQWDYRIDD